MDFSCWRTDGLDPFCVFMGCIDGVVEDGTGVGVRENRGSLYHLVLDCCSFCKRLCSAMAAKRNDPVVMEKVKIVAFSK